MKKYLKYLTVFGLIAVSAGACKKADFVEANTDPKTLYSILPKEQYLNAVIRIHNTDFEWYYDNYRRIMPWMQYLTPQNGNAVSFLQDIGNFNQRYGNFYNNVGNALEDVIEMIDQSPDAAAMEYMKQIAIITQAQYAFYVSEINGSIPYTQAFRARYENLLTPEYDTQEQIFTIIDQELKTAISVLKTPQAVTQESYGVHDQYYKGNFAQWIKAANALRLRIATRLEKRNPARMKEIALEVLADAGNLMTSNADNWAFVTPAAFSSGGNWNPEIQRAPKPIVDFMWTKSDPRLRLYYAPNNYTQENFNLAKAQNKLGAAAVFNPRRFVGSFTSPDAAADPANATFYNLTRTINVNGTTTTLDTLSQIQRRLFHPAFNGGTGTHYFPVITYSEFAFTRAELAAKGVTTENAATLYEDGVRSSIELYNTIAQAAQITEYVAVTPAEITTYLAQPDIAYNPAKGVEQIAVQAYLHYYKQPNEGWSLWKRTGLPNQNTLLSLPQFMANGVVQPLPRRAQIRNPSITSLNYENEKAAVDAMATGEGFGQGPSDMFGRVWWDKP